MAKQAACPQLQESSILSRAPSQYGPQYLLPFSGAQLQAGCAHLFCVFVCCSLEFFSASIVAPFDGLEQSSLEETRWNALPSPTYYRKVIIARCPLSCPAIS